MQKRSTTKDEKLGSFDSDIVITEIESAATEIEGELRGENMHPVDNLKKLKATLRVCHAVFSLYDLYYPPRAGEAPMPENEVLTQLGVDIMQAVDGEAELSEAQHNDMVDILLSLATSRLEDIHQSWRASS